MAMAAAAAVGQDGLGQDGLWKPVLKKCEYTKTVLGNLYKSYEPQYYWWESVELIRKLMLTGVIIFIMPETPTQLGIGLMLTLFFIVLYSLNRPLKDEQDDVLQLVCQLTIFTDYFAGLLLMVEAEGVDSAAFHEFLLSINILPVFLTPVFTVVGTFTSLSGNSSPLRSSLVKYGNEYGFKALKHLKRLVVEVSSSRKGSSGGSKGSSDRSKGSKKVTPGDPSTATPAKQKGTHKINPSTTSIATPTATSTTAPTTASIGTPAAAPTNPTLEPIPNRAS